VFSTNLKIFIQTLARNRLFSLINVLGLSIGFASCLLISLYVMDEFSYDTQHPAADRIYRLSSFLVGVEQGGRMPIPSASPLVGPLLQQNFPEVEAFTRIAEEPVYLSLDEQGDYEEGLRFVDANFMTFFHFDWLQGDATTALAQPDSIVLTETLARKYFGSANPMGRELNLKDSGPLKVSGVIRDLTRTHLSGTAFVSLNALERLVPEALQTWFGARFQVYLRLREGVAFAQLQPALYDFLERQMPPAANALYDPNSIGLREIHLSGPQFLELSGGGKRQEIVALMLVCVAVLGIACINFINLTTVKSSERGKEIAMRKVLGARRGQIFWQHMGESGLLVVFALVLGVVVAELALPLLNAFSGKAMSLTEAPVLLTSLLGFAGLVALLAGAYPALYLSAFVPTVVLKALRSSKPGGYSLRNLLVVLQFAIAIVLIVATSVIYQQVQYGKTLDLGFDKDQVLVIENPLGDNWSIVKERLLREAGASVVSGAMNRPFKPIATSIAARHEGGDPQGENRSFFMVDFDYFELFGAKLLAGRSFSATFGTDRQVQPTEADPHPSAALVLNRAMVEQMGWAPEEAVGKTFELNWSEDYAQSIMGEVVGVIDDMRVDSLRREVVPLLYLVPASIAGLQYALVKIPAANIPETLRSIDAIWREVYPEQPINRYFLDTAFQSLYSAEEKQISLLAIFAALAIAISCLGLFALATFTADKRGKEVGIRKTFGGSTWAIVLLLTRDFSKLVLLANLIAWPIAYLAMSRWLENFAYRIDLTPLLFIGSGAIALCIAWVTVAGTVAKAASQRPVLALRYE
jgi:putative ABC transport system permease protein